MEDFHIPSKFCYDGHKSAIYAHFIIFRYSSFLLLVPRRYIRYVLFLYYNYIPFLFLFFSFFLYPGGTGSLIWQL